MRRVVVPTRGLPPPCSTVDRRRFCPLGFRNIHDTERGPTMRNRMMAATILAAFAAGPALAQDVPGIEICTVEKTMERRTSCLQSNVNFLQTSLGKQGAANDPGRLAEDRRGTAGGAEEAGDTRRSGAGERRAGKINRCHPGQASVSERRAGIHNLRACGLRRPRPPRDTRRQRVWVPAYASKLACRDDIKCLVDADRKLHAGAMRGRALAARRMFA